MGVFILFTMEENLSVRLYNKVIEPLLNIEKIFIKWFGEDKVDFNYIQFDKFCEVFEEEIKKTTEKNFNKSVEKIKSLFEDGHNIAYIYFGTVDVTNEKNNSERIYGLIARIKVDNSGKLVGGFLLNRHIYTRKQLASGYMHSHVSRIPFSNPSEFQSCCLGNGPIRYTIASLNANVDYNLWELFCVELQRYVETESLHGGPYHRLETLSNINKCSINRYLYSGLPPFPVNRAYIANRLLWYILHTANFNYVYADAIWQPAISPGDFVKFTTKKCLELYSTSDQIEVLFNCNVLRKGIVENEVLKTQKSVDNTNLDRFIDKTVCIFKGKPLKTEILPETQGSDNNYCVLDLEICDFLWSMIILLINSYSFFSLVNNNQKIKDFYEKQGDTTVFNELKEPIFV